jgi:hypothetical protein
VPEQPPLVLVHRADGTTEVAATPRVEVWDRDDSEVTEVCWLDPAEMPHLQPGDRMQVVWPDGRSTNHYPGEGQHYTDS